MSPPLVLVLVGTDHHPFDRLVDWVDSWASGRHGVRVLVQRGTSRAAENVESVQLLQHAEVQALIGQAAVVVSHGGPSTIAECRRQGVLPLVVPRDPRYGEHVDGHQRLFTARLAADGLVLRAEDEGSFSALLDRALSEPALVRIEGSATGDVARSCERFAEAVGALFAGSGRVRATTTERVMERHPGA